MSEAIQLDYFKARALQERGQAKLSKDSCVALVHLCMADEYDRRAQMIMDAAQPA